MVLVDPVGSVLKQYKYTSTINEADKGPLLVEGVGSHTIPPALDWGVVDSAMSCEDKDALATCRRLAREQGISVGGSSGMTVHAALRLAIVVGKPAVIVCLLNDHGVRHMRKVYNPEWLHDNAMITKEQKTEMIGKQPSLPKPSAPVAVAPPVVPPKPAAAKQRVNLDKLEKENSLLLI